MAAHPHITVERPDDGLRRLRGHARPLASPSSAARSSSSWAAAAAARARSARTASACSQPAAGAIFYDGDDFLRQDDAQRELTLRRFGVLYQSGALFSSMTLAENVGLPLGEFTDLSPGRDRARSPRSSSRWSASPASRTSTRRQLRGGMQKRAGLARAMALDPEILFLDEPSAGLDPISSRRLDELILELRDSLGATVVIVSHELASILAIGDDCDLPRHDDAHHQRAAGRRASSWRIRRTSASASS